MEPVALAYFLVIAGEVLDLTHLIHLYTTGEDDAVLRLEVPVTQEVWKPGDLPDKVLERVIISKVAEQVVGVEEP